MAAARPRLPDTIVREPVAPARLTQTAARSPVGSPVSPVSAYAPTSYDAPAGFMSGRGLY